MRKLSFALIVIVVMIIVAWQSLFIVNEREQVIVTRFGTIENSYKDAGLKFRLPFVDRVYRFDKRLLALDSEEFPVLFNDNRRLIVDAFSRYRINDLEAYYKAVVQSGQAGASEKLAGILEDSLKGVLGKVDTNAILSEDRTRLMNDILDATRQPASEMGVEVQDVRIVRADLPPANLQATFERMSADRQKEAADERARGAEAARRITAAAEREAVQTVSNARRQAEIIKGQADAQSNAIFAEAYGADPEFFDFYRSLQAYEEAIRGSNTSMVLDPDSDFFRFLNSEDGVLAGDAPQAGALQ